MLKHADRLLIAYEWVLMKVISMDGPKVIVIANDVTTEDGTCFLSASVDTKMRINVKGLQSIKQ